MIKASFYTIDEELEDAAKNLGASPARTFLRVKLPIILPSVLAVFALSCNVNASGRRGASVVFIILVSGLFLYLVYGAGARDLSERLEHRAKWHRRWEKLREKR